MKGSTIILDLGSFLALANRLSRQICSGRSILLHLQAKHLEVVNHWQSINKKIHPQRKQISSNRGAADNECKMIKGEEICWGLWKKTYPMCWSCRFHTRRVWGGCGRRAPLPRGSWRGDRARSPAGATGKPGSAPRPTTWRWSETRECWEAAAPGSKPKGCLERRRGREKPRRHMLLEWVVQTNLRHVRLKGEYLCCTQCCVLMCTDSHGWSSSSSSSFYILIDRNPTLKVNTKHPLCV